MVPFYLNVYISFLCYYYQAMSCTLSSLLSPSLILLPPHLTHNLDLSSATLLLLICYTLHCVQDFSPMALLQENKMKPMKYIFWFIAIHTSLSRAQDITRRNTVGWQFRNKYHTNKNAFHYAYQILLECTDLKDDTMWDLLSQGISYASVFPIHLIFIQDQVTKYTCTFPRRFGMGVAQVKHGRKQA